FPRIDASGRLRDGTPLRPGLTLAILSNRPDAFAPAGRALGRLGLSARLLGRRRVPGPDPFTLTFLTTGLATGSGLARPQEEVTVRDGEEVREQALLDGGEARGEEGAIAGGRAHPAAAVAADERPRHPRLAGVKDGV